MNKCKNCGGLITFNPEQKGNICEQCNSVFPIEYNYTFSKKGFEEASTLKEDKLLDELKNIQCKSCGASLFVNKTQLQAECPYCGDSSMVQARKFKLMYIDTIVPFTFGKAEALKKFKSNVGGRFFANKKIFKNVKEENLNGSYINTFVFDFNTSSNYTGVFSYTRTVRDKDGKTRTETVYKNVSGVFSKTFKNITIEANSNLDQNELQTIEPFEYASAVEFKPDFLNGYILEHQDKMFNNCVADAEKIAENDIRRCLLRKHGCDRIVSLKMSTDYTEQKYSYCLLPVYFVNVVNKETKYRALMNGQTGKVGKLPLDIGKILFIVLGSISIIVAIILFCVYSTI